MHRLNLARRCVSKPPGPFGARRGQWASAGGAATLHVAYKLRQGRDVERTTAVTPMFSDLDKKTKGTAGSNKGGAKWASEPKEWQRCADFSATLNRGKKRQSHGVTAHVHSYLCSKSTRGRYRHDSHRPCVVLAFQRRAYCLMVYAGDKDRDPTGCFLFPSLFLRADCPRSPPKCLS